MRWLSPSGPVAARAARLLVVLLLPAWLGGCALWTDAAEHQAEDTLYQAVLVAHGLDEGARLSAAIGLRLDAHALDIRRLDAAGFSTRDLTERVGAMSREMHRREAILAAERQVLMQATERLAAEGPTARLVAGQAVRARLASENRDAMSARVDTVLAAARELESAGFRQEGYAAAASLYDSGYERRRQWLQKFTVPCRETEEKREC